MITISNINGFKLRKTNHDKLNSYRLYAHQPYGFLKEGHTISTNQPYPQALSKNVLQPDVNGNLFYTNLNFELGDGSKSTLNYVDPLGNSIPSISLNQDNEYYNRYLSHHDLSTTQLTSTKDGMQPLVADNISNQQKMFNTKSRPRSTNADIDPIKKNEELNPSNSLNNQVSNTQKEFLSIEKPKVEPNNEKKTLAEDQSIQTNLLDINHNDIDKGSINTDKLLVNEMADPPKTDPTTTTGTGTTAAATTPTGTNNDNTNTGTNDDKKKEKKGHDNQYEAFAKLYDQNPTNLTELHKEPRVPAPDYPESATYAIYNAYSILFAGGVFGLIVFVILIKDILERVLDKPLQETLNVVLRDISMLIIIDSVFDIVCYYELLANYTYIFDIEVLTLSLLIFSFLWGLMGIIYVITAQFYSKTWRKLEDEFPLRDEIRQKYEDLFINQNRTEVQEDEMNEMRNKLEYFLIKQEFIYPTFLPVIGEAYLREDFDFASYLGRCISKSMSFIFKYSFNTVFAILLTSGIWFGFTYLHGQIQFAILMGVPIILFVVLLLMRRNLNQVYNNVISEVDTPYAISFTKFDNIRQANINIDKMNMPKYLKDEVDPSTQKRWFSSVKKPNRQEILFWWKSPRFIARLLHMILILELIWLTACMCRYYSRIRVPEELVSVILGTLVTLLNLIYFMPTNMKIFSMISNIQMLKDKKIIKEVVNEKTRIRMKSMMKLYRLLKSATREWEDEKEAMENSKPLKEFMINQLRDYYKVVDKSDTNKISISELAKLSHQCGHDLVKQELVYLGRLCTKDINDPISFEKFSIAIEKMTDNVTLDPYEVSKQTIERLVQKKQSFITIKSFREIIQSMDMLSEEDLNNIINEIRYLPMRNAEISIDMIARLIRDSIEGLPR